MTALSPAAKDALRGAETTDRTVVLVGQLARNVYTEVDKALQRIGGKWNRKAAAHVFTRDPRPAVAELLATGAMPRDRDKDDAFFRTPPDVVERLAYYAGLLNPVDLRVLEPSAGDGAIADGVTSVYGAGVRRLDLVCVEPDAERHGVLVGKGYKAEQSTFEDYAATEPEPFDAIVMNPPFATPGRPVLWAEHVLLAYGLLKDGGHLAAVIPTALERQHRTVRALRSLVDANGYVASVPEGAFKASGTGVNTAIVVLTR